MKPTIKICLAALLLITAGYCHAQETDIFVRIELPRSSISTNDSIMATIKLYTQREIHGFGKTTFPAFKEFTVRAIKSEPKPIEKESYKGKTYHTGVLQQYMLHPKQSGKLTIESGSYTIIVRQKKQQSKRTDDFFDTPQYTADTVRLTNPEVTLTVLPSPGDPPIDSASISTVEPEGTDTAELQHDPPQTADSDNTPSVEKPAPEKGNSGWISINEENRKLLLYTSITLLALLLVVYFSKSGAPRDSQYDRNEQGNSPQEKRPLVWHLPYIVGIVALVGLIAVLCFK